MYPIYTIVRDELLEEIGEWENAFTKVCKKHVIFPHIVTCSIVVQRTVYIGMRNRWLDYLCKMESRTHPNLIICYLSYYVFGKCHKNPFIKFCV